MKTLVTRIDKCELCGKTDEYTVRDTHVNSNLTNKDIHMIVFATTEQPQNYSLCTKCDTTTLTTTLAFNGLF